MIMNWLEITGYIGSAVVAVSLMMRNVFWLRVINLIGGLVFSVYGLLIQSAPVAVMNGFVVCIDLYYIFRSFQKDYYKILEVERGGYYLKKFLKFYHEDILKFIPEYSGEVKEGSTVFFVLCNMVPAGLLITHEHEDGKLWIEIDFAIPDYRDFKLGRFVYQHQAEIFDTSKYNRVYCNANSKTHQRYLERMGFSLLKDTTYRLDLYNPIHRKETDLIG